MVNLIYDGSFDGLLTAIFEIYEYKFSDAEIVAEQKEFQQNIFERRHTVYTDSEKAQRVLKKLEAAIGKNGIRQLLMVFLSEKPDRERLIFSAVRQSILYPKKNILNNLADPDIISIAKTVKSVGRESHRMTAFVRFEKLQDESFFAKIEPDFNVLPLVANHFKRRYQDQKWMIFDLRRNYGVYWDFSEVHYFMPEEAQLPAFRNSENLHHDEEKAYQKMWQRYFVKTGIEARKNMKLHIQWVPKRYWKYLTEKA